MKIGILGAGQLGCMLAESIFQLGGEVCFYNPNPHSPGFKRTPNFTCAEWDNFSELKKFFSSCDVVTYEFENVKTDLLNELIHITQKPLYPNPNVLHITQNRFFEKEFLRKNNFPVVKFEHFLTIEDFSEKIKNWSFPFVIKTTHGGYDGKGQWKIWDEKCLAEFISSFECVDPAVEPRDDITDYVVPRLDRGIQFPLIAEELIDLKYEASVIVARDKNHNTATFPVFENIHENHILHTTYLPTQIPTHVCEKLISIATEAAQKLNVVGLLTTEFFIDKNENIFVNEFAPRPHNSGHVSRKACNVSQFDLHARVLLDLPLIEPHMLSKDTYFMRNIMGEHYHTTPFENQKSHFSNDFQAEFENNSQTMLEFYLYGKDSPRPKRKMGHFIASISQQ